MAKSNRTEQPAPDPYAPSPVLSPGAAALALRYFEDYQAQLWALGDPVLGRLAEYCNEGGDPPDDAPLQEWRLMQVLMDQIQSKRLVQDLQACMGQHLLPSQEEVSHG